MRGVLHGAGGEKQQALEDRVIEHVQQPGGKTDDTRAAVMPVAKPKHTGADAEQDDPDVLDAVIGEQPLQIVLRQREQHAENAARCADREQQPAPPCRWRAEQRQDPDQAIDAHS